MVVLDELIYIVSQKRIDIIDCNLKDYQILIIFGTNIPNTTGHQTTVHVSTSPHNCASAQLGETEHTE